MSEKPLVVDLDGTLIHSDMLHESALRVFRDSPFETLRIPFLLKKGKACLKQHLASQTEFDPKTLPYNEELLEWLRQQRAEGRYLVLCTASDKSIADRIAEHLNIFDEVIASDGISNIEGKHKAAALVQRFQQHGYDYAGNSTADCEKAFLKIIEQRPGAPINPGWTTPPEHMQVNLAELRR